MTTPPSQRRPTDAPPTASPHASFDPFLRMREAGATKPAPQVYEEPSFLPALEAEERERRSILPHDASLQLTFEPSGHALMLPLSDAWILGRATMNLPASTPTGAKAAVAKNKTVSREHCMIRRRDDHAIVIDLKSTNGTFINGMRLDPYREYVLAEGDELKLATLRAAVTFVDHAYH